MIKFFCDKCQTEVTKVIKVSIRYRHPTKIYKNSQTRLHMVYNHEVCNKCLNKAIKDINNYFNKQ